MLCSRPVSTVNVNGIGLRGREGMRNYLCASTHYEACPTQPLAFGFCICALGNTAAPLSLTTLPRSPFSWCKFAMFVKGARRLPEYCLPSAPTARILTHALSRVTCNLLQLQISAGGLSLQQVNEKNQFRVCSNFRFRSLWDV